MKVKDLQIWLNNKIKENSLSIKPLVEDGLGGPANQSQKTLEFIEKAIKVHGDKFDYSLVDYKNSKKKVNFICKSCKNIFEQIPNSHLSGYGYKPLIYFKGISECFDANENVLKIIKGYTI